MAPARTGKEVIKRKEVIIKDHSIKGKRSKEKCLEMRFLKIVAIKLILPKIDEIPAKCKEKIAKSTEIPLWYSDVDRGG